MNRPSNEGGFITFRNLVWLLIAFTIVYSGYKFLPPEFSYQMMKGDVKSEAKAAHMYTEEKLKRRILDKAAVWKLPLNEDDLSVLKENGIVRIRLNYSVSIVFLDRYVKVNRYYIDYSGPIKEADKVLQ